MNDNFTQVQLLQELDELRRRVAELEVIENTHQQIVDMLRESEAKTKAILAAIPDLMFRLSRDGTHLEFYASELDQLFVQPEDFLGRRVDEVLPVDVAAQYIDNIQRTLDSGQGQVFEYTLDFDTGRKHYEARMVMIWRDEVLVMVRNVTERVQAEEALRFQAQLLDAAGKAIIATNPEGQIIYWNRFAERLYGWTADETIGQHIVDITPTDATREQAAAIMAQLLEGDSWSGEFMVQHKDGSSFPAFVVDTPIYDHSGNLIGIVGVSSDITDRKRAEQQRLELRMERERIAILSNFITQTSHEFKTPLSIIASSTYLLKKVADSGKRAQQIHRIEEQVNSITALVDALTTMAKLDGIRELITQVVDLCQLISTFYEEYQHILEVQDLHSSLELKQNTLLVHADVGYLRQAIEAIIDNAIRFTPEGGTIAIVVDSRDGDAILEIADTGVGISEEDIQRIFERFYRADKAGTTRGFGLGLAIAKRVIDLHQGTIEVESIAGEGSTFRIVLPLV